MAKEDIEKKKDEDEDSRDDSSRSRRPARRQNFRRYSRRRQRQSVPAYVDWKDVEFLERFIPERGKIMPRRISGVSAKDQRRVARAIKRARVMALIPYVSD
ncbi:MAG: 30S ribosomal protein S18 [Acidobacteriota bacterium]|nr:MAG: 30S ribosomal protein S18 [Acidobacteriota bacterium]